MAFQAGAIVSKLTLDRSKFSAAIKGVKKETSAMGSWVQKNSAQFKKMGLAITAMGTAALFTFKKMVDKYVEVGDQIDKMSKRTGVSATALSELAHAADLSGTSLTDVEKGIKKMAKSILDARRGLETYARSFRQIGLDVSALMRLNPEDQFIEIGSAIAKLTDETEQAAIAQEIFGRAGTMLLPMFKEGKEGMKAMREEAHTLGIVFDEEAAAKAAKLKDEQTRLKKALQGLGFAIVKDLMPLLTKMAQHFTDVFVNVRDNAKSFTGGLLDFFGLIAKGIEGLMLAWHGFQAAVYKIGEFVGKIMKVQIDLLTAPLKLLEKIPGKLGEPARLMLDAVSKITGTLTVVTDGYNEAADEQAEKMADIIEKGDKLKKTLDDLKIGLTDFEARTKKNSEVLIETLLPAAGKVDERLLKLAETHMTVTEWTGKNIKEMTETQLETFNALASGMQAGLSGVMSTIKQMVIGEMLKSLATSKMPFLAKLAMMLVTVGLVEAVFKKFMKPIKGYAEGGRIGTEGGIVGEEGPELFQPSVPGEIIPLKGSAAGRIVQQEVVIAPVFNINAVDEYSVKRFIEERGAPALIEMLRNKHLLDEFQKAAGIT